MTMTTDPLTTALAEIARLLTLATPGPYRILPKEEYVIATFISGDAPLDRIAQCTHIAPLVTAKQGNINAQLITTLLNLAPMLPQLAERLKAAEDVVEKMNALLSQAKVAENEGDWGEVVETMGSILSSYAHPASPQTGNEGEPK